MSVLLIIGLILAILVVIFTLQNTVEITINLFFWEIQNAPLALVILCCIVLGYFIAAIYLYTKIWHLKSENKKLTKANSAFDEKLRALQAEWQREEDNNPLGTKMGKMDDNFSLFNDL
ncbi:MAG: LapA family protein [Bacteroidales bacterium]|nr:LapA family protein [Bacteroidales bacterium]